MIESAYEEEDQAEAWLLIDGLGWMLSRAGRHDEWLEAIDEGRQAVERNNGPEIALALADIHEAYVHIIPGELYDLPRGEKLIRNAEQWLNLDEARRSTDPIERLVASRWIDRLVRLSEAKGDDARERGMFQESLKHYKEARKMCEESLEVRKSVGDELGSTYHYIGRLSLCVHELSKAKADLNRAKDAFNASIRVTTHRKYAALSRYGLAQIAELEEEWSEAERQGRRAVVLLEQLGLEEEAHEAQTLVERVNWR
jgi:tetratricopeptide (TPR) repeat protein